MSVIRGAFFTRVRVHIPDDCTESIVRCWAIKNSPLILRRSAKRMYTPLGGGKVEWRCSRCQVERKRYCARSPENSAIVGSSIHSILFFAKSTGTVSPRNSVSETKRRPERRRLCFEMYDSDGSTRGRGLTSETSAQRHAQFHSTRGRSSSVQSGPEANDHR